MLHLLIYLTTDLGGLSEGLDPSYHDIQLTNAKANAAVVPRLATTVGLAYMSA